MIESKHLCKVPEDSVYAAYGKAITQCSEANDGTFWVDNEEYATSVKFCPFCGEEALDWRGELASSLGTGILEADN